MTFIPLLRRFFQLSEKRQKRDFALILAILAITAGLSQATPLAIGRLTDHVMDGAGLSLAAAAPFLLVILVANILKEGFQIGRRLIVEDIATKTEKRARGLAVLALLRAPMSYFREHMTGNIHGRLNRSLEGTTRLQKLLFMDFAPSVASGVAAIVVIIVKLPLSIALLMLVFVPIGTAIVLRQIHTQQGIRVKLLETKAGMDGTVVELLNGIETIRSCDSVETECRWLDARSEELRSREMRHHRAMAFYDSLKFVNEAVFNVLVIGASVLLAAEGSISVGTILTSYLCFMQLTGPLRELHRILDELAESTVLARQYFQIKDIPADFSYAVATESPLALSDNSIRVENLRFHYPENPDKEVLGGIDVAVRSGEFVGIAGPSGCGKSSFVKILDKLEPAAGSVRIGNLQLDAFSRGELAKAIFMVPQSPFIISDTIYNNVCYGYPGAATLEEVKEATRRARIGDEIEKMPGQYDFKVSESGGNLSGGQRQRLALARVFMCRPRILILDEATSALDNTSEKHVQREIERLARENGTTVISIAHRLTTLENSDRILVFNQGHIVEEGDYRSLASREGLFKDMVLGIVK